VRRIVLTDAGLDFAMRVLDVFAQEARALRLTVLERRQVNWIQADYREELRQLGDSGSMRSTSACGTGSA
jgi:hypothetical protein